MNLDSTNRVLNRLLAIHSRSLLMYLRYAAPWTRRGDEQAVETIQEMIEDQQRAADRIGETILDLDGEADTSGFPIEFARLHYLSLDFLLPRLIEHQRKDLEAIEACVAQLDGQPKAQAVAREAAAKARRRLQQLEQLQSNSAKAPS